MSSANVMRKSCKGSLMIMGGSTCHICPLVPHSEKYHLERQAWLSVFASSLPFMRGARSSRSVRDGQGTTTSTPRV